MRKNSKWFIALMTFILVFSMSACGDKEKPAPEQAPADCFADQYVALIESGEARDFADYDDMAAQLSQIVELSGATYAYVMSPAGEDGTPSLKAGDTAQQSFLLTVDGSEDPDDWAEDYGWEIQFTEAWEGTPAAARSAWDNDSAGDDHDVCWSGFAPVKDKDGNVVCILGIDYPCANVLNYYPQWNRDNDEWNGCEDEMVEDVPYEIQETIDTVTAIADKYANILSHRDADITTDFGDQYVDLIVSEKERDYIGYDHMKAVLDKVRTESGATYAYILSPTENNKILLDSYDTSDDHFFITVDGSEDPDDWGVDYKWEIQFTEAWEGTPAAARSAWENNTAGGNDDLCWSAFAPIYNSEGNVVCILGIDYPCADVVKDYPQWNRDSKEWNQCEDEITEEVPADIQSIMDKVIGIADKYAKMLSQVK